MLNTVKAIGHGLMKAAPSELTIGNIIRRILKLIKEEHQTATIEELNKNNNSNNSKSESQKNEISSDTNTKPTPTSVFNDKIVSSTSNIIKSISGDALFNYDISNNTPTNNPNNPNNSNTNTNPMQYQKLKQKEKQFQYNTHIPDMRPNLLSSINEYIDEVCVCRCVGV